MKIGRSSWAHRIAIVSRLVCLFGVGSILMFAAADAISAPPGPAWPCQMVEAAHWPETDGGTFAVDVIEIDCIANKGWGCPGHEKAWLWRWVNGAWSMCGSGPFVDRSIIADCGQVGMQLRAGVNIANAGPPGNQWCITHRVWDSWANVLTTEQSFFKY